MEVESRSEQFNQFLTENNFYRYNVVYKPSDEPADLESIAHVRQNAWKKEEEPKACGIFGLLALPYAHTKSAVDEFNRSGRIPEGCPKQVASLPLGSIVYVPEGNESRKGILVRLVSEVKAGILPQIIVRKARTCQHSYTEATKVCEQCSESVKTVTCTDIFPYLRQGYILEPYYSLYRDCDYIADVLIEEGNLNSFAAVNSSQKKTLYWKRFEVPR